MSREIDLKKEGVDSELMCATAYRINDDKPYLKAFSDEAQGKFLIFLFNSKFLCIFRFCSLSYWTC